MSRYADAPLQKITINIYEEDYEWLKETFGQGWSEHVRDYLRNMRLATQEADYERG
jgi:hypothetical protein